MPWISDASLLDHKFSENQDILRHNCKVWNYLSIGSNGLAVRSVWIISDSSFNLESIQVDGEIHYEKYKLKEVV